MESTIELHLKESLSLAEEKFKDDNSVKSFERSQNEFKGLVSKGIAKERGNNLLSPSDNKTLARIVFNAK